MEHKAASLKVVMAGFQYMLRSSLLLGASSLDLFVVLLGGATALMPIFAHDILHQGPRGLGLLRAAPAVGALMHEPADGALPFAPAGAGMRLFVCVAIFGAATVVFGLSHNLWLSLAALAVAGGGGHDQRDHPRVAAATGHAAGDAGTGERRELAVHWRVERVGRV
jgi:hypothetical protein